MSFHGGVETATAGLLGELVVRGYAPDLFTTAGQVDLPGVAVKRLPVVRRPSVLRLLSFALAARLATRDRGYDLVQSHERTLWQDVYRAGEGTHEGYLRAMGRHRARANPHHQALCALERRIFRLRSARHVVAISRRDRSEIHAVYRTPIERVSVVYNGVDLARFTPDNRDRFRAATRESLDLSELDWVVLFVGSGFERKGLGPLVEAMSRAADARTRLVVAGKGRPDAYQRQAHRLGLERQVRFVGPRPDVERLYAMADVVALPALYEPFGNVHLEALASGVPVLTSARAGGAEAVTHGESGWVVAEPSAALIAEGLSALRDLDGHAARAAARRAALPFTHAAQVDALEGIWGSLAPAAR